MAVVRTWKGDKVGTDMESPSLRFLWVLFLIPAFLAGPLHLPGPTSFLSFLISGFFGLASSGLPFLILTVFAFRAFAGKQRPPLGTFLPRVTAVIVSSGLLALNHWLAQHLRAGGFVPRFEMPAIGSIWVVFVGLALGWSMGMGAVLVCAFPDWQERSKRYRISRRSALAAIPLAAIALFFLVRHGQNYRDCSEWKRIASTGTNPVELARLYDSIESHHRRSDCWGDWDIDLIDQLAFNPNIPKDLLLKLADRTFPPNEALIHNPATPRDVLETIARGDRKHEAEAARRRLGALRKGGEK